MTITQARIAAAVASPTVTAEEEDIHPFGPSIIAADALMAKVFPEPRWAVDGIFPEGLILFVGPPKIGKSWLALNVAVAVALGGVAIGKIPVEGGDVLYLALEDTQRRLQDRLETVLQGEAAPPRLHIATEWPSLADGAAAHLRHWLHTHPDARLVIVDTLAKLRGAIPGNQNVYAGDYDVAGQLKKVADEFGVAVVVIHHTRKMTAEDPLDMVSGSTGLAGAADATIILKKEIGRSDGNLYIRGRDVPEADHALSFDPEACCWTLMGDAATYRMSKERAAIVDVLAGALEPMAPKDIAAALGKKDGAVRKLLHSMSRSGEVTGLGGSYRLPLYPGNTGNAGNGDGEKPETTGISFGPSFTGGPSTGNSLRQGVTGHRSTVTDGDLTGNAQKGRNDEDFEAIVTTVTGVTGVHGIAGDDRWTA